MVLEDVDSEADSTREVTPMSEIRRRKSITLNEFDRRYPEYEWSEGRKGLLLQDDYGGLWVPLVDPLHGLYYEFQDPELTPEIEEALAEEARRALEEVRASGGVDFRELDEDDSFWGDD